MNILKIVRNSTPAQCREMGELLISIADDERDEAWYAMTERVMAQFQSPAERGMAEQMAVTDALHDALKADGMDHRSLIEAELERRGDPRTYREYADAMGIAPSGQFEGIRSNVEPA